MIDKFQVKLIEIDRTFIQTQTHIQHEKLILIHESTQSSV